MPLTERKITGIKKLTFLAQILRGKMWNVVVHSLTLYLNSLQIFTLFHHIMPILHVFLVKHPYFKFLPVSPGFCRLKLAGLNRFLPAGLNRSGRNQTTLFSCLCPLTQNPRAKTVTNTRTNTKYLEVGKRSLKQSCFQGGT